MSDGNKDVTYFNFFPSSEEQINLEPRLSLPEWYTQRASGSNGRNPPENGTTVREITLWGKTLAITDHQPNSGCSSSQQEFARAMPPPPDHAEEEISLTPNQMAILEKRLVERQKQLVENEEERDRRVRVGNRKGESGIGSSSRTMENLELNNACENSTPRLIDLGTNNKEVIEIPELFFNAGINSSRERNPRKRLRASAPSDYSAEVPTPLLDLFAQMPNVMVTGPTGQKVQGILAKFGPEHMRVVCVCHGSFFNAVEFVKHAGWNEVANPLQQIMVFSK